MVKEMAIPGNPQIQTHDWPPGAGVVVDANSRPLGFCAFVCDPALRSKSNPQGECLRYTSHQQRAANDVGGTVAIVGKGGRATKQFEPFVLRRISGHNGDIVCIRVPPNLGSITGIKRAMMRKFTGEKPVKVLSLPEKDSEKLRYSTSDASVMGLRIIYKASTSPGSSGSPIYQGNFVVGTHVQSRVDPSKGLYRNEGAAWFAKPIGRVAKESPWDNGDGYSETERIDDPEGFFRDSYYNDDEDRMEDNVYAAADRQIAFVRAAESMMPTHFISKSGIYWADSDSEDDVSQPDQDQLQDAWEGQYSRNTMLRQKETTETEPQGQLQDSQNFPCASGSPLRRASPRGKRRPMDPVMNLRLEDSTNVVHATTGQVVAVLKPPPKKEISPTEVTVKELVNPQEQRKKEKLEEQLETHTAVLKHLQDSLDAIVRKMSQNEDKKEDQVGLLVVEAKPETQEVVKTKPETQEVAEAKPGTQEVAKAKPETLEVAPAKAEPKGPRVLTLESTLQENPGKSSTGIESEQTQCQKNSSPSSPKEAKASPKKAAKKKKSKAQKAQQSSETKPLEAMGESAPSDQITEERRNQLLNMLWRNGLNSLKDGESRTVQLELKSGAYILKPQNL